MPGQPAIDHRSSPQRHSPDYQAQLSEYELGEKGSVGTFTTHRIKSGGTGYYYQAQGSSELHHISGTDNRGRYIPPHQRKKNGHITRDTRGSNPPLQIREARTMIKFLELEATGRHTGDGKMIYSRQGFKGVYTLQRENDGTVSVHFTGGLHRSSRRTRFVAQTFVNGVWRKDRKLPLRSKVGPLTEGRSENVTLPPVNEKRENTRPANLPNQEKQKTAKPSAKPPKQQQPEPIVGPPAPERKETPEPPKPEPPKPEPPKPEPPPPEKEPPKEKPPEPPPPEKEPPKEEPPQKKEPPKEEPPKPKVRPLDVKPRKKELHIEPEVPEWPPPRPEVRLPPQLSPKDPFELFNNIAQSLSSMIPKASASELELHPGQANAQAPKFTAVLSSDETRINISAEGGLDDQFGQDRLSTVHSNTLARDLQDYLEHVKSTATTGTGVSGPTMIVNQDGQSGQRVYLFHGGKKDSSIYAFNDEAIHPSMRPVYHDLDDSEYSPFGRWATALAYERGDIQTVAVSGGEASKELEQLGFTPIKSFGASMRVAVTPAGTVVTEQNWPGEEGPLYFEYNPITESPDTLSNPSSIPGLLERFEESYDPKTNTWLRRPPPKDTEQVALADWGDEIITKKTP